MADYREITQEYAKGAIKTVILVNAGGIIATLNQLKEIRNFASSEALKFAILAWVVGIVSGVVAWCLAYISTVEFGNFHEWKNSRQGVDKAKSFHNAGNKYAVYTAIAIVLSLSLFALGCVSLIFNFSIWMQSQPASL